MAEVHKAIQPLEYYRNFLENEVRPDGRDLTKKRPVALNTGSIGTAEGSAVIKQGNTTVMCGIKAELAAPKAEEPDCGYIIPNVDLPALCSPHIRSGPPGEQAQVASYYILKIIQNSKCVDPKDLCIYQDKIAWVLYCDLMCLDYDGNLLDACVTALVAALRTVQLPELKWDPEAGALLPFSGKKVPLKINSQPVSTTFAIFDDNILITDPTHEEESLASGIITIVLVGDEICFLNKSGGNPVPESMLQQCISRAKKHAENISQLVEKAVGSVDR